MDFKALLAKEACEPGVSVSKLARQHGINANMLFKWRRDLREGRFSASGSQSTHLLPTEMYLIQAEIRGKPPDERRSVRQARARCPTTWGSGRAPRSKSSRKFDTSGAHPVLTRPDPWPSLLRYCDNGVIEIGDSAAERAQRGIAIGRRNYLFAAPTVAANVRPPSTC